MPSLKILNLWKSVPESSGKTETIKNGPGAREGEFQTFVQVIDNSIN